MEIPKGRFDTPGPCWIPVSQQNGPHKPIIKCRCGALIGMGNHSVSADGTVNASWHHKRGNVYPEDSNGCEWHEWLKLQGYDGPALPVGDI